MAVSMSTQVLPQDSLIARTRNSKSSADCLNLYDEWAATYNADLAAHHNYIAPIVVAQAALKSSSGPTAPILDAGCGTGLVGEALAKGGAVVVDGADFSPPMLEIAKKTGAYQNLATVDLNKPVEYPDNHYEIVTCCGTFTHGHVGPSPALREFVRILKKSGLVIATIHDEIWEPWGFSKEVEKLEKEGLAKVVSVEVEDYRKGHDKARLLILEKL